MLYNVTMSCMSACRHSGSMLTALHTGVPLLHNAACIPRNNPPADVLGLQQPKLTENHHRPTANKLPTVYPAMDNGPASLYVRHLDICIFSLTIIRHFHFNIICIFPIYAKRHSTLQCSPHHPAVCQLGLQQGSGAVARDVHCIGSNDSDALLLR